MKIKDIINNIDKTQYSWCDLETIAEELGIYTAYNGDRGEFIDRFKSYWFVSWTCTDTTVGGEVYTFDGVPVAISFQEARKCDKYFEWVSKEAALSVKQFVMECCEDDFDPSIVDLDQDIDIEEIKRYQGVT